MKHALIVSFYLATAAAFFLTGGCSNNGESAANEKESTGSAHLQVQAGDSLLFSEAGSVDSDLSLPADMSDSLVVAFTFVEPAESLNNITSGRLPALSSSRTKATSCLQ